MKPQPITERVVDDVGGAFTVGLAYIGDRLGLFAALAALGKGSSDQVAQRAGLNERYVREWLRAMVASQYVEYDPADQTYFLTPEQQAALVDEAARTFVGGVFQFALPSLMLAPRLLDAFRSGGGVPFADLPAEVPEALDRMHRPWFDHLLVPQWLPGAPGLVERLSQGVSVLDVGCGLGRSTVAMARAFPRSQFLGIDPHQPSIDKARALATMATAASPGGNEGAGLANVRFAACEVDQLSSADAAGAGGNSASGFDLIVAVDCIHDMVQPVASLRAIRRLLSPAGVLFWSEPTGSREPMDNRNPQGKLRANLSPFHCLTVSLASGGAGLGTIIGEAGARDLAAEAGFASFETLSIESAMQQFFLLRASS
jgi:SAM-dependent methyltransferase